MRATSLAPGAAPPVAAASHFLEALGAAGPIADRGGARNLYGGLIGDWDADVVDHLPDGTDRRQSAEVHFSWVLEGRAIQDLWIAPARRDRTAPAGESAANGNRYGTTLRVYDPTIDAWRVTWWNPVTGIENRLVGRRAGSQIVQTGIDAQGRSIRWTFDDIRLDSFHWRGEHLEGGGKAWVCDTEFFARRRSAPPADRAAEARAERQVSWEWTDRPGLETLRLDRGGAGITADGSVLVVLDGAPVRVRYRVEHDAAWRFRAAAIERGLREAPQTLDVRRTLEGRWTIGGTPRPDLDGCEDVDLMVTPYTNTPPLAARPLAPGERRTLRVAWVRFPDLDVHAVEQEYTRLDTGDGPARYRYRNLESGFTGELTVAADGLVIDYGPWTRR